MGLHFTKNIPVDNIVPLDNKLTLINITKEIYLQNIFPFLTNYELLYICRFLTQNISFFAIEYLLKNQKDFIFYPSITQNFKNNLQKDDNTLQKVLKNVNHLIFVNNQEMNDNFIVKNNLLVDNIDKITIFKNYNIDGTFFNNYLLQQQPLDNTLQNLSQNVSQNFTLQNFKNVTELNLKNSIFVFDKDDNLNFFKNLKKFKSLQKLQLPNIKFKNIDEFPFLEIPEEIIYEIFNSFKFPKNLKILKFPKNQTFPKEAFFLILEKVKNLQKFKNLNIFSPTQKEILDFYKFIFLNLKSLQNLEFKYLETSSFLEIVKFCKDFCNGNNVMKMIFVKIYISKWKMN
ncbi:hypothetical protein ABK040_000897 [Willaertia magna]